MHPRQLSITDYTYALPQERIASHPLDDRDASRLLQFRDGRITDHHFGDLPQLLPPGSLLVMNDTRVVNARLHFRRESGARIEVFCLEPEAGASVEDAFARRGEVVWYCTLGNAKRWKAGLLGQSFHTPNGELELFAERLGRDAHGERVRLSWLPGEPSFAEVLAQVGEVPLPPYLSREPVPADTERYQTVYARQQGSVAAPTAGLHFTPALLDALTREGMALHRLTLHVGAGTFMPVRSETMDGHDMHREQVHVTRDTVEALLAAHGVRPIVAIGTTTLRTLESLYWHGVSVLSGNTSGPLAVEQWEPYADAVHELPGTAEALQAVLDDMSKHDRDTVDGATRLLIAPGYQLRVADGLITNFHQPGSTLLLLVAAFIGAPWRQVYAHALKEGYRFLSYGDGSLLWRSGDGPAHTSSRQ